MAKYTLEVGPDFDKLLSRMAETKQMPKAEIIRRAVASYAYLNDQTKDDSRKVSITTQEDKVVKDVVLP